MLIEQHTGETAMTKTAWSLVAEAENKTAAYAAGVGSFSEALSACRAAERWLDEGPEDSCPELHRALSEAAARLPDWAF